VPMDIMLGYEGFVYRFIFEKFGGYLRRSYPDDGDDSWIFFGQVFIWDKFWCRLSFLQLLANFRLPQEIEPNDAIGQSFTTNLKQAPMK